MDCACRGLGIVLAVLILEASPVRALGLAPNPLAFDLGDGSNTWVAGTLELVETTVGVPSGGTVVEGAVGSSHVTFVFDLFVTENRSDLAPASTQFVLVLGPGEPEFLTGAPTDPAITPQISGFGVLDGPNADLLFDSGDLSVFGAALQIGDATLGEPLQTALQPNRIYDRFFVSFSLIEAGDELYLGACGAGGLPFPIVLCAIGDGGTGPLHDSLLVSGPDERGLATAGALALLAAAAHRRPRR